MDCREATKLVEKLVDGELTDDERTKLTPHLEACESCGEHSEFLRAVAAASAERALPDPPEAYWDALPRKVLSRIEHETGRIEGIWPRLFSSSSLRWGALAATILVAVTVGFFAARDGALHHETAESEAGRADEGAAAARQPRQAAASPEAAPPPEPDPVPSRSPASVEEEASQAKPAVAVDERVAREEVTPGGVAPELPAETAPVAKRSAPPAAFADEPGSFEAQTSSRGMAAEEEPMMAGAAGESAEVDDAEAAYRRIVAGRERVPSRLQAMRSRSLASETAASCEPWREYLEEHGDGPRALDARYELVRCSLARYELEPTPALRDQAIRDAENFLSVADEGPRAREIRDALESLRR